MQAEIASRRARNGHGRGRAGCSEHGNRGGRSSRASPARSAESTEPKSKLRSRPEETGIGLIRLRNQSGRKTRSVVTTAHVKELREQTGAGIMDCKRALEEAGGDLKKAVDLLKQTGSGQG